MTDAIVAAADGSEQSLRAVEWAACEAAMRGAALQIVTVPVLRRRMAWESGPEGAPQAVADAIVRSCDRVLARAAGRAAEVEPGLDVRTALWSGPPARALCEAASHASMLVAGSRGSGRLAAMVLGSVSRHVATHADCPVVVAREETAAAHREIVVGVRDLDQPAAIGFAFEEAALRKARLRIVHAWHWFLPEMRLTDTGRADADTDDITAEATQWLAGLVSFWREKYPEVDVAENVAHGRPARILAGCPARADLTVLGRNRTGGSCHAGAEAVLHAVLSHAHGPVAIIPE
jgi:nucleotide-binding universal stress UspA family protein